MKYRNDKSGPAKNALRSAGVRPSKKRGQNFLIDEGVIDEIALFGNAQADETLIEIGPGLGALTKKLYAPGKLSVIEIEEKFCEALGQQYPELKIINQDVRQVDFSKLGSHLTVFGNLPYVYSTEIVFHLLRNSSYLKRAVLLLQKEFAERMAAQPGGRDYGSLSVAVQLWANIKKGPIINGDRFHPPTKVTSQVIELEFLPEPKINVGDASWFEKVVRASFSQRRKKLSNSLRAAGFFKVDQITRGLEEAKIDGNRRAETLSISEFAALAAALKR